MSKTVNSDGREFYKGPDYINKEFTVEIGGWGYEVYRCIGESADQVRLQHIRHNYWNKVGINESDWFRKSTLLTPEPGDYSDLDLVGLAESLSGLREKP